MHPNDDRKQDQGRKIQALGRAIVIAPADNVATVIHITPSTSCYRLSNKAGQSHRIMEAAGPVDFGHKIALTPIPSGGDIIKYGETIGRATIAIDRGEHVHIHNMESCRGKGR